MKRGREEDLPAANTIPVVSERQSIETKDKDVKIVRNSPYGATRSSFGWGTPFAPAPKAIVEGFSNIHIGLSSLNATPAKDRDMSKLVMQYLKKFSCLEHCYPYHRMSSPEQWLAWKGMVSKRPDFVFTIKANQYLTHTKMLDVDADVAAHINNFFAERCLLLGEHLGPVLVQLPPQFRMSTSHLERLRAVAARIPAGIKIAVEFRHKSWFVDEVYDLLKELQWGLVVTHNEDIGESPFVITNKSFLYVRLHGAVSRYVGDYGPTLMQRWAEVVAKFVLEDKSRNVYFFLNNNESQISGLTSSVVDATCLAKHLAQLLKDPTTLAAGSCDGGMSGPIMGGLEMLPSNDPEVTDDHDNVVAI